MVWRTAPTAAPHYVIRPQSDGTFLVSTRHGTRIATLATSAEAEAYAKTQNVEFWLREALGGLQFLDELGGPDAATYCDIMERIARECEARAQACREAHGCEMQWTAAGFDLTDTGGGCQAFRRDEGTDGLHILATIRDDSDVPKFADDAVDVGLYCADHSDTLGHIRASSTAEALRKIAAGEWTPGNFDYTKG